MGWSPPDLERSGCGSGTSGSDGPGFSAWFSSSMFEGPRSAAGLGSGVRPFLAVKLVALVN
jgi:hypothetical protein